MIPAADDFAIAPSKKTSFCSKLIGCGNNKSFAQGFGRIFFLL